VILKTLQTLGAEPRSSPADAVRRAVQPGRDVDVLHPLGGVEDHPRALHHSERQRHRRRATLKLRALIPGELDHMPTGPGHEH
jgi:hypothetical protein